MQNRPVIVVVAYNRPNSLLRLLSCLLKAHYTHDSVQLLISVDLSDDNSVIDLANKFQWPFGEKLVIHQSQHLGLKKHILACGDLTLKYGSIILLEDDLVVSPWFYKFAIESLTFYGDDPQIAGISLYNYELNENNFQRFKASEDASDVYLMQVTSSWGVAWKAKQWRDYKEWLEKYSLNDLQLPDYIKLWGNHSWKKDFTKYLISKSAYFVFPRLSLTSNTGVQGVNQSTTPLFNVPMQMQQKEYHFLSLAQSNSKYDAWFEPEANCLQKLNADLQAYDFTVDLLGTKSEFKKPFVLTGKPVNKAIRRYSSALFPLQDNVIANLEGEGIFLVENQIDIFSQQKPVTFTHNSNVNVSKADLWFGIHLIIQSFDKRQIEDSLLSIQNQQFANLRVTIFCSSADSELIGPILSGFYFQSKIQTIDDRPILELTVLQNLQTRSQDILLILYSGMVLKQDILFMAHQVFSQFKNIQWIKGIDQVDENTIDTRGFRINAAEAYTQLCNKSLKASLSGQFIRQTCFIALNGADFSSQTDLYLLLITRYVPVTLVLPFVNAIPNFTSILSDYEWIELKKKHQVLRVHQSILDKVLNKLSLMKGNKPAFKHWLYTSKNHYHDVLRYDANHANFYYSKY